MGDNVFLLPRCVIKEWKSFILEHMIIIQFQEISFRLQHERSTSSTQNWIGVLPAVTTAQYAS
jgi:hypothetical protein